MKPTVTACLATSVLAALALSTACSDDHAHVRRYGSQTDACAQYASCDTCTPVLGCGWCYDSDGTGLCASDPDGCTTQAFSWTWDPTGCRVGADAGVVSSAPLDAGVAAEGAASADASSADASSLCALPAGVEIASDASDAGGGACTALSPTTSNLCSPTQVPVECTAPVASSDAGPVTSAPGSIPVSSTYFKE